jgi:hypothetical protein
MLKTSFSHESTAGIKRKPSTDGSGTPSRRSKRLNEKTNVGIPEKIAFPTLKEWLKHCKTEHGPRCDQRILPDRYRTPVDINLIDVENYCVVEKSTACDYFALSYVWGASITKTATTHNLQELQQTGSLRHNTILPKTLSDAILLTRQLGVRYLWVDCLCIVQDSSTKHEDIKNMDIIFSQAEVTIVAASGQNANSGLAGVRLGTRSKEDRGTIVAPRPSRHTFLEDTTYNSRGW